jgi:hypothetical protein
VHGNIFGTQIWEDGPRGRDNLVSTSMVMTDLGKSVGDIHYLNVDLMLTAEKWTVPESGYPLLLQIGERNSNGVPYLDAQHPHSSPVMGLTFSDTISLEHHQDYLKLFFAPRGESTDGPVAFMHRITGMQVNPDAPLGHHIGQDVGHISSTVIGGSLKLGNSRIELSTYHGREPDPNAVNLPFGNPDSVSARFIEELTPNFIAMISAARVQSPEDDESLSAFETRFSTSVYFHKILSETLTFDDALIYGLVNQYDHANSLSSFTEEFLFRGPHPRIFGRIEVLERTPNELEIANLSNPNSGEWVAAFTAGYSHQIAHYDDVELNLGGSITKYVLPENYLPTYGSNPWSGKIFLELSGMTMVDL